MGKEHKKLRLEERCMIALGLENGLSESESVAAELAWSNVGRGCFNQLHKTLHFPLPILGIFDSNDWTAVTNRDLPFVLVVLLN
jgi:hypothetical protein